jgi:hypothetical protein
VRPGDTFARIGGDEFSISNCSLEMLQALHCEYGQGHFFSKALPVEWAASMLFANANMDLAPAGLQNSMPAPISLATQ